LENFVSAVVVCFQFSLFNWPLILFLSVLPKKTKFKQQTATESAVVCLPLDDLMGELPD